MKMMTEKEMSDAIDNMSKEEADYLKHVITRIVMCFAGEDRGAVIVFASREGDGAICAVNVDEEDALEMLTQGRDMLVASSTAGAPAREMFN